MNGVSGVTDEDHAVAVPSLAGYVSNSVEERVIVGGIEEARQFPSDSLGVCPQYIARRSLR